jgi:hypothetical protein
MCKTLDSIPSTEKEKTIKERQGKDFIRWYI